MRVMYLLMLAAAGCGADTTLDARGATPSGAAAGSTCPQPNLTQACRCDNGWAGSQTCSLSAWSSCSCRAPAPGSAGSGPGAAAPGVVGTVSNNSPTRFDWQRTEPSLGSCEAGHYEGTFGGIYGPSIIVVSDLKVIPVFPIDLPGSPGLAFDLMREGQGEVFTVSNGKMNGNALGAFPFTADIVGKLDCDLLKFDAQLVNGSYFIGPLEYRFEGPLIANYDKQSHSFIGGTWEVMEPDWPGAGGGGDWSASWKHN
ncbi:MAG: hypothetical protein ABW321_01580 [Polyangiales bacterium]